MTVTDIYVKLRLEQSVASQHLAILRKAGVVQTERDGKFIFYSLGYQPDQSDLGTGRGVSRLNTAKRVKNPGL